MPHRLMRPFFWRGLVRLERFRRAYEHRVESGAQQKYYERTKYKKRTQYEAEKAALFEESYTLGANALAPQSAALPMAMNQ